ncbi:MULTISPECIES: hypothetical protein [unclassified Streptomyces]|uniref:hypothetical protein n=1 Tax=unclassified Streptomyces TaxID=2593676 RepID=UPI0016567E15|nr:hypothetical protein [Streptomyces sp. CB02980]MCB8902040.1 hypothetical protein [Streptomyces sp. CB02980]
MSPNLSFGAIPDLPLLLAIGVPGAAALALAGWRMRRRGSMRRIRRAGSPSVKVAAVAALGCTAYSADTSWRFAADYLDMAGTAERAGMFAAAELALFATALMARQNLAAQGAPGLPGTLVWVITGVQVIPAYAESGPVGGTVRAFVGPIMAAMLWHLAMGIELRLRTPGAASHSLVASLGREVRERLLSRLGIAARDRDAAQITRDRATARAVTLAARLAELTPQRQQGWHGRRLARRLSKAIGRSAVGTDPAQRAELLDQLAARRHALTLATVPLPSPWSPPHHGQVAGVERIGDRELTDAEAGTDTRGYSGPTGTDNHRDRGPTGAEPGTNNLRDRGPSDAEPGTDTHGDRGPSLAEPGTGAPADQGPTDPESGTGPGDRGHKVPRRRKPTTRAKPTGSSVGRARSRPAQRPSRELEAAVEQLVKQVQPHVPALLARDGNETLTRVQLREILRREGLQGGRNERLSLVLQQLRSEESSATTRSTTR